MNRMPPSGRSRTILDVAQEAGVSKSTVSLVLQGSPLIPPATAQRVQEAARRIGYVYNRRAAALRQRRSNVVGVVINDLLNPYFAEVLVGLERGLGEAGYQVLMAHTAEKLERQQHVLQTMREHDAAGIVLCPVIGTPPQVVHTVREWGIALTVMVRRLGEDHDFAGSANAEGVALAMGHLIARGHRRIAFLGGRQDAMLGERAAAYRAALQAHGLRFESELMFEAHPSREAGHAVMRALLAQHPGVKAALCYNDVVAFGALSALGEQGLRAGTDFALMGFDNVLDAAHSNPPLSTVDVSPPRLGEQAAALLLARIADPALPRQTWLAPPSLIVRQSA